jgi:excisionase family DNA binding protein
VIRRGRSRSGLVRRKLDIKILDIELPEAPMSGRLLDRSEVADLLHVSEMTVRRLGAAGHLTEVRVGKRAVRVTEASIEAHIAARRIVRDSSPAS